LNSLRWIIPAICIVGSEPSLGAEHCNLVFDGDSISVGQGSTPGYSLADATVKALHFRGKFAVVGRSGSPVSERVERFEQTVAIKYDPSAKVNIILFHAGDNDIAQGASAGDTFKRLESYISLAHNLGWRVVASTEMQRFDFAAPKQAELLEYNRLLMDDARSEAIADFANENTMTRRDLRLDPSIFTRDQVHPSNGGYEILGKIAAEALKRVLPSECTESPVTDDK
jgi:lysophospholipase L1-like esterase